jgi:hypothetical protein
MISAAATMFPALAVLGVQRHRSMNGLITVVRQNLSSSGRLAVVDAAHQHRVDLDRGERPAAAARPRSTSSRRFRRPAS